MASSLVNRLLDAGAMHPAPTIRGAYSIGDVTVVTPQLGGPAAAEGRLVVDDGSRPPITGATVRLDQNQGPAAARNAGRERVTTPLIAFVDADVDLLCDVGIGSWLDALLPHFDDPLVGLVAPRVAGEAGSPLDLGPDPARIRSGTRVSYVPAAAIVVRVDAFDAVGGFDERLRFGEDVDFVWRLDQAGWRCRYEPASMVWHAPRRDVGTPSPAARWLRHLGGAARPSPSRCAVARAQQRMDWRGVGLTRRRPPARRGIDCRRHGGASGGEVARRAGPTRISPRNHRSRQGRRTVRRGDTTGLVAARDLRRAHVASPALGRTRRRAGQPDDRADRHRLRLGRVVRNASPPHARPAAPPLALLADPTHPAAMSSGRTRCDPNSSQLIATLPR